jgi:hypothetical protein
MGRRNACEVLSWRGLLLRSPGTLCRAGGLKPTVLHAGTDFSMPTIK